MYLVFKPELFELDAINIIELNERVANHEVRK